jgi:ribosomal protein S18 acetylase RimI-like enzyme
MDVVSLGFRTDLMLRRLAGASISERGDHIVVRTPANPGFWWGNFVLFLRPPEPGDASRWSAIFATEFAQASYLAIGVDGKAGRLGDAGEIAALGVTAEVNVVLTTAAVREPARPGADVRRLDGDDEWAQLVHLRHACHGTADTPAEREFTARSVQEARQICEEGGGAWFGAFIEGRVRAGLGLFHDGGGLARFQTVETHPDFRRRGLASALLHDAGRCGTTDLGAHTLVIVADPDDLAIHLYRGLGFVDVERQVQLQRAPKDQY